MQARITLTIGERLRILRTRRGESQQDAASRMGVTRHRYMRWESGVSSDGIPRVGAVKPTTGEAARAMRHRSGMLQQHCASELGVCRYWYRLMEQDKVKNDALRMFWGL